ncbi:MAG TPA: hypothetical protein PLN86_17555 [Candidatus Hydrogenedentes bacterium]|nr:hypothetical protein [Candidatus Hydrogenedentota bacterium]
MQRKSASEEAIRGAEGETVSENLRMMLPSFFTEETGTCAVPEVAYTELGQAQKPYRAMETRKSAVPLTTLVIGHNDLSTGGVPRHDPDRNAISPQVTEPAHSQIWKFIGIAIKIGSMSF